MPLTDREQEELYQDFAIILGNQVRQQERHAVEIGDRQGEVTANCHHTTLNKLRIKLGVRFNEEDFDPSVYGENAGGK